MSAIATPAVWLRAVWNVLAEEVGARPDGFTADSFAYHFPQCGEFRFQGDLGFGGKVYADARRVWVDCYPEDRTPARVEAIAAANARLQVLRPPERSWVRRDVGGAL